MSVEKSATARKKWRRLGKWVVFAVVGIVLSPVVAIVAFGPIAHLCGARGTWTGSLPSGFYWKADLPVDKGADVMFCPPDNSMFDIVRRPGYIPPGSPMSCPGGFPVMMKQVVGLAGDHVIVSASGVYVNGKLIPDSKPDIRDPAGRPMPHYRTDSILKRGQVFLMSERCPRGVDGRYFGPINTRQIKYVVRPVWTCGKSGCSFLLSYFKKIYFW